MFLRFGRGHMQPLLEAIGNPRRDAADAREAAEAKARQEEYKAQVRRAVEEKAAEREAHRPTCARCGVKFTDARWKATGDYPKPGSRWHPTLCGECQAKAIAAEEWDDGERQGHDDQVAEVPEQKAGGWLSRMRSWPG
ncbi:hypothetical protein ACF05T_32100 [Streptomyces lateritius]|uniref:HNH endonuclease n=1 Tax=Streptomyces lateritius TaxID=67313 RepID=A0ABW6YLQ6_9ACTN